MVFMNLKEITWSKGKYFDNKKKVVNPIFIGELRTIKDVAEGDLIDIIDEDLETLRGEKFSEESTIEYEKINAYLLGQGNMKHGVYEFLPIHFCQINQSS